MIQKPEYKCPLCNQDMHWNFDMSWGRCHFFLHCYNCFINVGIDDIHNAEKVYPKLLESIKHPHTVIEYYDDKAHYF